MQFGRDLRRGGKAPWLDAAALELLPLALLRRETAAAGLGAHQAERSQQGDKLLGYSILCLEVARRTGEHDSLVKAAQAAERAARLGSGPAAVASARIQQGRTALAGATLFGEEGAIDMAHGWLATPEVAAAPGIAADALALRARIEASRALGGADLDAAVEAAGVFDTAVERFDVRVQENPSAKVEAAALRSERAEFLIGFGVRLKNRSLVVQAEADLRQLVARLDPDFLPLSWARAEALRGVAQGALGDLDGDARAIGESVRLLASAAEQADFAYSPLDRARISHAMALSLQTLAEATEDDGLYDHAIAAHDQALAAVAATPTLPLRAMVIHDRAACVARRAERAGDLRALGRAEDAFRAELARRGAAVDPVAWAVTQLALTRLYEIRAELQGESGPPPETAFALTEAQEVFAEHGLKALGEQAEEALGRLRAAMAR